LFEAPDDICKDLAVNTFTAASYLQFIWVHRAYYQTPQAVDTGTLYRHDLDSSLRSTASEGKLQPGNRLAAGMSHSA